MRADPEVITPPLSNIGKRPASNFFMMRMDTNQSGTHMIATVPDMHSIREEIRLVLPH